MPFDSVPGGGGDEPDDHYAITLPPFSMPPGCPIAVYLPNGAFECRLTHHTPVGGRAVVIVHKRPFGPPATFRYCDFDGVERQQDMSRYRGEDQ